MLTTQHWITAVVTIASVVLCVVLHYEALRLISDRLPTPAHHRRLRIVYTILAVLLVHVVEIWIFGIAYYVLVQFDGFGTLVGIGDANLFNCVYYSAAVFSTLGFGDIVPSGPLRLITGMEGIAGLTFITWSASYTYLMMTRTWTDGGRR